MDRKAFIDKVEKIISEQENKDRATGAAFNILEIAHINRDEVRICRLLHSIINPKGEHLQEAAFLILFIRTALGISENAISDDEIKNAVVKREVIASRIGLDDTKEKTNETDRRVDLVIKTDNWLIPIEVKIDADDLQNQCYDYYTYANKNANGKKVRFFYLTKDSKEPSKESSNNLSVGKKDADTDIRCISFKEDICAFIDRCLEDSQLNERLKVSFEILRDAIKGFCDFESKATTHKIIRLIKESEEIFRSAVSLVDDNRIVSDCLDIIKRDIIKQYFENVKQKLGEGWNSYKESEISKQFFDDGEYQASVYFIIYPEQYWYNQREWKGKPVVGVQIWKNGEKMLNAELKKMKESFKSNLNVDLLRSFKYNWINRECVSEEYNFLDFGANNNRIFELIRKDDNKLDDLVETTVNAINKLLNLTAS